MNSDRQALARGPRAGAYLILVGLGLAVRAVMLLLFQPGLGGDGEWYRQAAETLRQTGTYTDHYRPPLYPAFLAMLPDWNFAFALQSAMTVTTACLCLRLTRNFPAAVFIAVCPFFIVYEYAILAETLLIALLFSAWLMLDHGRALIAGLLLGLAILTRDTVALLPLFALPFAIWLGRGRQVLIAAAAAYLVAAPWVLAQGELSSGRAGYNLWVGTWERNGDWMLPGLANAAYPPEAFTHPGQEQQLREAFREGNDSAFRDAAVERMTADPLGTLAVWAQRYPKLWLGTRTDQAELRLETGSPQWTIFKAAMWGLNLIILIAGIAGLIRTRDWFFAIPILYTALIYLPFHNTEARYSLPALPFLLYFAAAWARARLESHGLEA